MDFLSKLFDTDGFMPRWDCGTWTAAHGWLHVLSDLGVWSAYLAIPCVLLYYIVRKKDLPFRTVFLLFGVFILACGTTHLMEAIIFWWPAYRFAGLVKLVTAIVSWATVIALIPTTPKVLAMRSPEELAREIDARQAAEAALRQVNAELESRVQERTAELETSNADLTYHKAQLQEADRRKDEFLATLAHELRNPLAPLRNGLHLLRTADEAGAKSARETMERQLYHMIRLVEDLLDVSRISRGRLELRKSRIDVATVFQAALETSQPLVQSFGHRLHVELPKEPIWLEADQVRLAQVVANLVNNAAKYTNRGGDIWVSAAADNGQAVVRVRDSGLGIPDTVLPRVFDLFAQGEHTLDRTHGGLGIGLKLVKQLVELHGGSVEARSEGRGRGSEFVVRLPRADAPEFKVEATAPASSVPKVKRRMLVVDDNRDAADSLADILKMCGHDVMVAYDGPSALALADKSPPEVAILDIGLPMMSGHELGRVLRGRPWGKDLHLIALTGWGQESDKQRTQEVGFDAHLVKPVDVGVLLDMVNCELNSSR